MQIVNQIDFNFGRCIHFGNLPLSAWWCQSITLTHLYLSSKILCDIHLNNFNHKKWSWTESATFVGRLHFSNYTCTTTYPRGQWVKNIYKFRPQCVKSLSAISATLTPLKQWVVTRWWWTWQTSWLTLASHPMTLPWPWERKSRSKQSATAQQEWVSTTLFFHDLYWVGVTPFIHP